MERGAAGRSIKKNGRSKPVPRFEQHGKPAKRHRCGKGRSRVSLAGQARSAWAGARGLKICESGMRIIGGKFKGRVLKRPGTAAIRPTSDRLRETVFNILAHAYGRPFAGARIIDLYAGTGAMGVEAL